MARWFYDYNNEVCGPISGRALRLLLRSGQLPGDVDVSKDMERWTPACEAAAFGDIVDVVDIGDDEGESQHGPAGVSGWGSFWASLCATALAAFVVGMFGSDYLRPACQQIHRWFDAPGQENVQEIVPPHAGGRPFQQTVSQALHDVR